MLILQYQRELLARLDEPASIPDTQKCQDAAKEIRRLIAAYDNMAKVYEAKIAELKKELHAARHPNGQP